MRKFLGVCLLALFLAAPTIAGEMPNDRPAPPPSQQTSAVQEPTNTPDETTVNGEIPNDATDSLTQTALELLAVFSSLL